MQLNYISLRWIIAAACFVSVASCQKATHPTHQSRQEISLFVQLGGPRESEAWQQGKARLESSGTNAVLLVLNELDAIGIILHSKDTAGRQVAFERRAGLHEAIQLLGPKLSPFAREFVERLNAGVNSVDAAYALSKAGDSHSESIIQALTNKISDVRLAAAGVASEFQDSPALAGKAVEFLVTLLQDESPLIRLTAARTIGKLATMPDKCLPTLLGRVQNDSDEMVRVVAVGAICQFGTNALSLKEKLQEIAGAEREPNVKRALTKAIEYIDTARLNPTRQP